jgi:hypothetical protein
LVISAARGFETVAREPHIKAPFLKTHFEHFPHRGVVINNKDAACWFASHDILPGG